MPGGRQIPVCTQKHHRTIKKEELFLTLYNVTLLKLHLTTCVTLPRRSENIQQISKFPSQNIFLGPSSVCNHIFELVQISVTEMQYKTIDLPHAFYPGSLPGVPRGHLLSDLESFPVSSSANTKSLLLQYTFSGGVNYCLNNYTCYKTRFHLLSDVLVVLEYLESRHLPPDKLLLASPTANSSHSNFSIFD
jgi:hypothetical protein